MKGFSFFKFYILAFFVLFVIDEIDAQIKSKLFYNNQWEITSEENASYYRECYYDTISSIFTGVYNDYTISHINIGKGRYENNSKSGLFQYCYDNGQLFCEGNFVNDNPDSIWTWYYSNGHLMQTIYFNKDKFDIIQYSDSIGNNIIDEKKYIWSMDIQIDADLKNMKIIGPHKDHKKDGKWKIVNGNDLVAYDSYKKGIYKKSYSKSLSMNGWRWVTSNLLIPYRTLATEQFFYTENVSQDEYPYLKNLPKWENIDGVGIMGDSMIFSEQISPKYLGGMTKLKHDIAEELIYPINEVNNNKGGSVLIEVIIGEDGLIESKNVLKSPSKNFSKEALRVINFLDDFKPAIHKEKPIKSRIIITVTFNNLGIIN